MNMKNVFTNREYGKLPFNKKEILELVVVDAGGVGRSRATLENLLSPMKDLAALYQFLDNVEVAAGRYAELLQEQEALTAAVAEVKAQLVTAQNDFDSATKIQEMALANVMTDTSQRIASLESDTATKTEYLVAQITELEKRKAILTKEIEDDQTEKLRLSAELSAEYDLLWSEMLVRVAKDEEAAKKSLNALLPKLETAKAEYEKVSGAMSKLRSGGGSAVVDAILGK
jgi:hypothetical protein